MPHVCPSCSSPLPKNASFEVFRSHRRVFSYWCAFCHTFVKGHARRDFDAEDVKRGSTHGRIALVSPGAPEVASRSRLAA